MLLSCAAKPEIKIVTQIVERHEVPPAEWLTPPQKPIRDYKTNGDLFEYSVKLESSFDKLAINLKKIEEWVAAVKERDNIKK
jgi:hypothetical protein